MIRYIAVRVVWAAVLLWFMTVFTFLLLHVIPGNPAVAMAGPGAKQEQVDALTKQMGLDQPLWVQYQRYFGELLHLDLGTSVVTGQPVTEDLARALPATIELVVAGFLIYAVLAVVLGIWSARSDGRASEPLVRLLAIVGSAMPVFWLAAMLQILFFTVLGWLPHSGQVDISSNAAPTVTGFGTLDAILSGDGQKVIEALRHLVLPVATIVIAMLATGLRATRESTLQELRRPYVSTAQAKGVGEGRILFRHVLRNASNPILSTFALQFGFLLGWVVLVETVFNWPGIGLYLFRALQNLDYAPILAVTLLISAVFILVNLLSDLAYPILDPRLRNRGGQHVSA